MFWRERVDRSGFHFGLNMGPEVGWHKRIIRTMPENWPVNELLTENDMEHNVVDYTKSVSYTHLRAHETVLDLVCRLLLEKKKKKTTTTHTHIT